jgi:hypothetical protein
MPRPAPSNRTLQGNISELLTLLVTSNSQQIQPDNQTIQPTANDEDDSTSTSIPLTISYQNQLVEDRSPHHIPAIYKTRLDAGVIELIAAHEHRFGTGRTGTRVLAANTETSYEKCCRILRFIYVYTFN